MAADPKKVERGKGFLTRVLAKVPEAKRATLTALLEDAEAEAALEEAGADGLRQDEFSKEMNKLKSQSDAALAYKTQLDEWWAKEIKERAELQGKLERLEAAGAGGAGGAGGSGGAGGDNPSVRTPGTDLTGYVKTEDVNKLIEARLQAAAGEIIPFTSALTRIASQHYKDFGEVLDTDALIAHCRQTNLPVDKGGYESFAKDKIEAKRDSARKAEIDAAEKRGEERARAAMGTPQPYPVATGEPLTLSGLEKDKASQFGVDAAVKSYNAALARQAG